jgi:hypothetical protein
VYKSLADSLDVSSHQPLKTTPSVLMPQK